MDAALAALPDDVETLKAALLAARAEVAAALAEQSSNRALIAHLKRKRCSAALLPRLG